MAVVVAPRGRRRDRQVHVNRKKINSTPKVPLSARLWPGTAARGALRADGWRAPDRRAPPQGGRRGPATRWCALSFAGAATDRGRADEERLRRRGRADGVVEVDKAKDRHSNSAGHLVFDSLVSRHSLRFQSNKYTYLPSVCCQYSGLISIIDPAGLGCCTTVRLSTHRRVLDIISNPRSGLYDGPKNSIPPCCIQR